jgi:hypothetical protein
MTTRTNRRALLRRTMPLGVALLGGGALLAACREQPVHMVSGRPFIGRGGFSERRRIILNAAATQGWTTRDVQPGVIEARRSDGSHLVVVTIHFTQSNFSFRHVTASPNLRYDGAQAQALYNRWVSGLETAIVNQSA